MQQAIQTATRSLILALAAKHRLPAVYPFRLFVTAGGLISYGTDQIDMFGPPTLTVSYGGRNLPKSRCRRRLSMRQPLILKRQRRLALPCRQPSLSRPTK